MLWGVSPEPDSLATDSVCRRGVLLGGMLYNGGVGTLRVKILLNGT